MRGLRQVTAATVGGLLTAFALVLLGAQPSVAGGPTSVLLVSPSSGRTAWLYGTQEKYGDLERLLARAGGELDRSREKAPEWGRKKRWGERIGAVVSVTWMLHDVTPWRLDRVYTTVPDTGDIWIHTTVVGGEGGLGAPGSGVWHRAKQPDPLRKLLTGLEILGATPGEPASEPLVRDDPLSGLADRAHWAIPALALGLLAGSGGATLLLHRAAARHGSGPPGDPRQELLDAWATTIRTRSQGVQEAA